MFPLLGDVWSYFLHVVSLMTSFPPVSLLSWSVFHLSLKQTVCSPFFNSLGPPNLSPHLTPVTSNEEPFLSFIYVGKIDPLPPWSNMLISSCSWHTESRWYPNWQTNPHSVWEGDGGKPFHLEESAGYCWHTQEHIPPTKLEPSSWLPICPHSSARTPSSRLSPVQQKPIWCCCANRVSQTVFSFTTRVILHKRKYK